jgi:hypothetical protein
MHRRTLLLGPALAAVFSPHAAAQPVVAFNFNAELDRARSMGRDLQPRIARIGLVFFSDAMMRARIQQAPLGYEKDGDFGAALRNMQVELNKLLAGEKPDLGDVLQVPPDAVTMMASKYEANLSKVPNFLIDIRKPPGPLQLLPDPEILRYQLWVSTLMAARRRDVWDIVWKLTGFFPFC